MLVCVDMCMYGWVYAYVCLRESENLSRRVQLKLRPTVNADTMFCLPNVITPRKCQTTHRIVM